MTASVPLLANRQPSHLLLLAATARRTYTIHASLFTLVSAKSFCCIEMASKYELFFREADKDGSGYLTVDEMIQVLRHKGYRASDAKIRVSK